MWVGDAIDLVGSHLELGPNAGEQGSGEDVGEDLAHDADGAEARLVVVGGQAEHASDEVKHALEERTADLVDEAADGGGGLGHLVGEDAEVPIWAVSAIDAAHAGTDDSAQDVFGRSIHVEGIAYAFEFGGSGGLLDDLGVEAKLVAKVIVDRGNIGSGCDGDFTDGSGSIAAVGEDAAGYVDEFFTGGVGDGGTARRSFGVVGYGLRPRSHIQTAV